MAYRNGQMLATCLHLAHPTGQKAVRTKATVDGLLVVDFGCDVQPIGIKITAPRKEPLAVLNELPAEVGEAPLSEQDYRPVAVQ